MNQIITDADHDTNSTPPATTTSTPTSTLKPRKARTKTTAPRELDVLDTLDPKKMTPQESVAYINACREAISMFKAKTDELQKTCESAFTQYKNADAAYKRLKEDADNKLAFCARQAQVCAEAIKMQGGAR